MPRCKICKDKFEPRHFLQKACFKPECLAEWSKADRVKKTKAIHAKEKKSYQLSDIKIRKKAAVVACHSYIKQRDLGNNCITCNNPLIGKYDSGHFLKAGSHSYTMFMEKNIHSQCVNCNQYNGGREKEYKEVLILKYGRLTVAALERARARKVKRTAEDYLIIERHYKQKLKSLL